MYPNYICGGHHNDGKRNSVNDESNSLRQNPNISIPPTKHLISGQSFLLRKDSIRQFIEVLLDDACRQILLENSYQEKGRGNWKHISINIKAARTPIQSVK